MKLTESVGIRLLEESISCQQMISAICDFTLICLVLEMAKKKWTWRKMWGLSCLRNLTVTRTAGGSGCPLTFLQNCVNTIVGVRGWVSIIVLVPKSASKSCQRTYIALAFIELLLLTQCWAHEPTTQVTSDPKHVLLPRSSTKNIPSKLPHTSAHPPQLQNVKTIKSKSFNSMWNMSQRMATPKQSQLFLPLQLWKAPKI